MELCDVEKDNEFDHSDSKLMELFMEYQEKLIGSEGRKNIVCHKINPKENTQVINCRNFCMN